jgi:hypothetical protein
MMLSRPGFTAVAVLSIALGIGATTAIFSVVYALLIGPYPYRAANRIGWIRAETGVNQMSQPLFTQTKYLEILSRAHSMEGAVAVQLRQPILTAQRPAAGGCGNLTNLLLALADTRYANKDCGRICVRM